MNVTTLHYDRQPAPSESDGKPGMNTFYIDTLDWRL